MLQYLFTISNVFINIILWLQKYFTEMTFCEHVPKYMLLLPFILHLIWEGWEWKFSWEKVIKLALKFFPDISKQNENFTVWKLGWVPASSLHSGRFSWLEEIGRRSEVRGRRSAVGGRRSEVRGRRSEVRGRSSELGGRGRRSAVAGRRSQVGGRLLINGRKLAKGKKWCTCR